MRRVIRITNFPVSQSPATNMNLKTLASTLARNDNPAGYNASVIQTEVAIAQLGRLLRSSTASEAFDIVATITKKAGLKPSK